MRFRSWEKRQKAHDFRLERKKGAEKMDKAQITEALKAMQVEGMDFGKGLQRFNNNGEIYLRILKTFIKSMPVSVDKLRDVNAENLADYAVLIHGLKGSCYGINADESGKVAESLEKAAKEGDLATVQANNGTFIRLIEELLPRLTEVTETLANPGPALQTKKAAPDAAVLRQMLAATRECDMDEMQKALALMAQFEYTSHPGLVEKLREQIDYFDYDAVALKVEELLRS
jgi:HPt (histidine-containing phosphotransfer) domain-containing protein